MMTSTYLHTYWNSINNINGYLLIKQKAVCLNLICTRRNSKIRRKLVYYVVLLEETGFLVILLLMMSYVPRTSVQRVLGDGETCVDFQIFQPFNEWTPVRKCKKEISNVLVPKPVKQWKIVNGMLDIVSTPPGAAYQRGGPNYIIDPQDDLAWRLLLMIPERRQLVTWIYTIDFAYWIKPSVTIQPPSRNQFQTITLCNTDVVLFGGMDEFGTLFNDTWLFNGTLETWQRQDVGLSTKEQYIPPRYLHTAVAIRQTLSNCTCQESMLVYGGKSYGPDCLGDLWELRCIADSKGNPRFYWIPLLKKGRNAWPEGRCHHLASDWSKTVMYMWGGGNFTNDFGLYASTIWQFNLTSRTWNHYLLHNAPERSAIIPYNSFFLSSLETIAVVSGKYINFLNRTDDIFYFKMIGNLIFPLEHKIGRFFGYSFVAGNRIYLWQQFRDETISVSILDSSNTWESLPNEAYKPLPKEILDPLVGHVASVQSIQNKAYVSVFYSRYSYSPNRLVLWQVDLETETWFPLYFTVNSTPSNHGLTYTTINNSLLVFYFSCPLLPSSTVHGYVNSTEFWVIHTAIRRGTLCLEVAHQRDVPTPRCNSTMVEMENGSLLMFGGITHKGALNDLWRLDVCDQTEFSPVKENCLTWVLLFRNGSSSTSESPSPRHSHAAFVFNGHLHVFGGVTKTMRSKSSEYGRSDKRQVTDEQIYDNSQVLSDMWRFRSDLRIWEKVRQEGMIPILACLSSWAVVQWGTKVVLASNTGERLSSRGIAYYCQRNISNASMVFDIETSTWSKLAGAPPVRPLALTFWKEKLVVVGWSEPLKNRKTFIKLSYLNPSCPPGQYSTKWNNASCIRCPQTSYAALGATHCSSCPNGMTTKSRNSTSLYDCVCAGDYCKNGKCIVTELGEQMRSPICQCKEGYTGTTCKYPTYFLIGGSALGVLILISLLIVFIRRMLKYRKGKKNVEEELTSAHKVWTIHVDEVKLEARIDGDTPGSYGEVYRAIYRDMMVAVKHLSDIMLTDHTIRKEFEREAEIMRAIRHPNIVMFFGTGKVEKVINGEEIQFPFLVLEFMSRGTLKKVLDSPEIDLSHKQKLLFALDAARGMQYLHSLSPPRIHRDIKSANLLVSDSWVVKISDFGSARIVRKEGERQATNVSGPNDDKEDNGTPLLRADSLLTRDTGTILWRAPEIFALGQYGTSADVYSFGIVLWEILCRDKPYEDQEFQWMDEVSRAVQSGIRPTIPESSPVAYVKLMKACWHSIPESRPTFSQVADCLTELMDGLHHLSRREFEATTHL